MGKLTAKEIEQNKIDMELEAIIKTKKAIVIILRIIQPLPIKTPLSERRIL